MTGDTKVVDRGKGDGLFVNTAGIGLVSDGVDVGRHGIAVPSQREGLAFETPSQATAPRCGRSSRASSPRASSSTVSATHTRGLATALNEIALDGRVAIEVQEAVIPVHDAVAAACELLGLDPLYIACEGRLVAFVAPDDAEGAQLPRIC